MALTRKQKEAQVVALKDKMAKASSIVFPQYIGLTVADITKLRSQLRKEKAEMQVAKKSLIQIAAKLAKVPEIADSLLPGAVACIFSMEEPTSGAGVAFRFSKDHAQVKLVGGVFSGKLLSQAEAIALATIPSRNVLLATFLSMCQSPLISFASACSSPLTGFARALSEIAKKKEAASPIAATPETSATATTPAA